MFGGSDVCCNRYMRFLMQDGFMRFVSMVLGIARGNEENVHTIAVFHLP